MGQVPDLPKSAFMRIGFLIGQPFYGWYAAQETSARPFTAFPGKGAFSTL